MQRTDIYGFGYLEPGDRTRELLDLDQRRFLAIENNLKAIYTIFGNGIIVPELAEGDTNVAAKAVWVIQSASSSPDGLYIRISAGKGHIAWKYAETLVSTDLLLPATFSYPVTYWIYATANDTTAELGTVDFIASLTKINDPNYYIGIGAIYFAENADNYEILSDGRIEINLFKVIRNEVNRHRHIGGSENPSPIDLGSHVQGLLSGDNISDLDASKITKGVLPAERLPQIDHENLSNKGTLSHVEIDSLLANLQNPINEQNRLSDIFVVNMLQLVMALKKQGVLNNLGTLDEIDKNLINVIMYQPGINADDSFVAYKADYNDPSKIPNPYPSLLTGITAPFVPASEELATIDKSLRKIIGGVQTGRSFNTFYWKSKNDFDREFLDNGDNTDDPNSVGPFYTTKIEVMDNGDGRAKIQLKTPYNFNNLSNSENMTGGGFPASRGWNYVIDVKTSNDPNVRLAGEFWYFKYFKNASGAVVEQDFNKYDKLAISYSFDNVSAEISLFLVLNTGFGTNQTFDVDQYGTFPSTVRNFYRTSYVTIQGNNVEQGNDIKIVNIKDFFDGSETSELRTKVIGWGFYWDQDVSLVFNLIRFTDQLNQSRYNSLLDPNNTNYSAEFFRIEPKRVNGYDGDGDPEDTISAIANIDSCIYVWNNNFYYNEGRLLLRFAANNNPLFQTLTVESSLNGTNSSIAVSTRLIKNPATDINSPYTATAPSFLLGGLQNLDIKSAQTEEGQDTIDILFIFKPSQPDRKTTPYLYTTGLVFSFNGETSSVDWDTGFEFGNKRISSTGILYTISDQSENTSDFISISNTSDIGNYRYLRHIAETGQGKYFKYTTFENEIYNGMGSPASAGGLFTTPVQAWDKKKVTSGIEAQVYGLRKPRDLYKLGNGNIVIVDTGNDRVVEVNEAGTFIRAIQGNVRLKRTNKDFIALTAYYNPKTYILYVCFSQYINISGAFWANMSIVSGNTSESITFDTTGVQKSKFKEFTFADTGDGAANGGSDNLKNPDGSLPAGWVGSKSATLQVKFSNELGSRINNWDEQQITVKIGSNVITSDGNDEIIESSTSTPVPDGTYLPTYLSTPRNLFKYAQTPSKFTAYKGLFVTSPVSLPGDFDGDNSVSSVLKGLDGVSGLVTVKVFVGEVWMDNLYSPISIQVLEDETWLVASVGQNAVNRYEFIAQQEDANISRYAVSFRLMRFLEGTGGSAYLMTSSNNSDATRRLLVASPAQANGNDGKVFLLSYINNQYLITNIITTSGSNAIRALPDKSNSLRYWVAVDDILTNGQKSGLYLYDISGSVIYQWSKILHPVGLSYLDNDDILISE